MAEIEQENIQTAEQENNLAGTAQVQYTEQSQPVHLVLSAEAESELAELERQYREAMEKANI
jgi:acyl transferase domain-containing protein